MREWTSKEVQEATGGKIHGDWRALGVTIDSRNIQPGELFVAITGERFDGHDFVGEALAKGAAAAIVNQVPKNVDEARLLVVDDTMEALRALARHARAHSKAKIAAVTGSVGKTSTKEALKLALGATGITYASSGNLNNHIGVPLMLANLPSDAQYAVFELGMNHAGEIRSLSKLVQPHLAIITTVEAVHLEFFDSVEAIADAKAEIFDGMKQGGSAMLNQDNRHFAHLAKQAETAGIKTIGFGQNEKAACCLLEYKATGQGCELVADINGTAISYILGAVGKHLALMSVAVLGAVDALGADLANAAEALANFREPSGRGALKLVKMEGGDITLINDSYNASPASMEASFAKLRGVKEQRNFECRTIAVLGDMLELGAQSAQLHRALLMPLINSQINLVFTAGTFMKHLYDALPDDMRGAYAKSAQELAPQVTSALKPHDIVLVKGSRGSRMDTVVDAIEDLER